jgi:hypothetical protein
MAQGVGPKFKSQYYKKGDCHLQLGAPNASCRPGLLGHLHCTPAAEGTPPPHLDESTQVAVVTQKFMHCLTRTPHVSQEHGHHLSTLRRHLGLPRSMGCCHLWPRTPL